MADVIVIDFDDCFRTFLTDVAEATSNGEFHIQEMCLDLFLLLAKACISNKTAAFNSDALEHVIQEIDDVCTDSNMAIVIVNKTIDRLLFKLSSVLPASWATVQMTEFIQEIRWSDKTTAVFLLNIS